MGLERMSHTLLSMLNDYNTHYREKHCFTAQVNAELVSLDQMQFHSKHTDKSQAQVFGVASQSSTANT